MAGGGYANGASGINSVVAGGESNIATNSVSTVGGGYFNGATGQGATVPGGWANLAAGSNSFAAGFVASAAHNGAFVWFDSSSTTAFASPAANQFNVRTAGGTRIFSNTGATLGVQLGANATSWSALSDRNAKKDFAPVDGRDVLRKLDEVPVQSWRYKWDAAGATPTSGASLFTVGISAANAQPRTVSFSPLAAGRTHTLEFTTNLSTKVITALPPRAHSRRRTAWAM